MHPFEFTRNNFSWILSHIEAFPRLLLCAIYLDKNSWLAIQIQMKFEFEWGNQLHAPTCLILFCAPFALHEKEFLM